MDENPGSAPDKKVVQVDFQLGARRGGPDVAPELAAASGPSQAASGGDAVRGEGFGRVDESVEVGFPIWEVLEAVSRLRTEILPARRVEAQARMDAFPIEASDYEDADALLGDVEESERRIARLPTQLLMLYPGCATPDDLPDALTLEQAARDARAAIDDVETAPGKRGIDPKDVVTYRHAMEDLEATLDWFSELELGELGL